MRKKGRGASWRGVRSADETRGVVAHPAIHPRRAACAPPRPSCSTPSTLRKRLQSAWPGDVADRDGTLHTRPLLAQRPRDGLDLDLAARLSRGRPAPDPGAPPPGLTVAREAGSLEPRWSDAPQSKRGWVILAAVVAAASAAIAAVAPAAGIGGLVMAALVLLYALRRRRTHPSQLIVDDEGIRCWSNEGLAEARRRRWKLRRQGQRSTSFARRASCQLPPRRE